MSRESIEVHYSLFRPRPFQIFSRPRRSENASRDRNFETETSSLPKCQTSSGLLDFLIYAE